MNWYVVIKTINGHRYFYSQKTYRDGDRVRTVNKYIGPVGKAASGAPIQFPLPLTTTPIAAVPTKERKPQLIPLFDQKKADRAFESVMGVKAAGWKHHWNSDRKGLILVERNRSIDGLLRKRGVQWTHNTTGCYYSPLRDVVNIPPLRCFDTVDGQNATSAYYVVVLHEVVHWTQKRVGREAGMWGADYAREELVAELGAVILMEHFGLELGFPERHALYFQTWLGRARAKKKTLAYARIEAERAVQWILGHEN